jgi:hypothetical protein
MNKNNKRNSKKNIINKITCSSNNGDSNQNIIEFVENSFKLENLKDKYDKNLEFSKYMKSNSIDNKIIFLKLLLEELYLDTKLDKFKSDAIFLEKWLWTLSDKKKMELNINL